MTQFIEKRHYLRVPLTYVTVDVVSKSNTVESSETCSIVDISENGMKFISKEEYHLHQQVHITFVLPGSVLPIQVDSIIIYQRYQEPLMRYTGIQFIRINPVEYILLKKYIELNTEQN